MGSILPRTRKNGKKSYRAKITGDDGKDIYKTFAKRRDAEHWLAQSKIQKNTEGLIKKDKSVLFKEYANYWLEQRKPHISPRSYENWESVLRLHIFPTFEVRRIDKITYTDGNDLQKSLLAKGLSNKSVNDIIQVFKQILIYATKGQGYRKQLFTNPLAGLEQLPKQDTKLIFWEKKEVDYFIEHAQSDHYYPLYLLALNTGMRLGELAGLQVNKVDLRKKTITVSNALKRTKAGMILGATKSKKTRHLPMNLTAKEILKAKCKGLKSDDFIFLSKEGSQINTAHMSRLFHELQKRIGVERDIRFHDLRHTYASHYMMNGGQLFTLQKLLGHSDIKTTMIYAHLSPTYMQNVADVVEFKGIK